MTTDAYVDDLAAPLDALLIEAAFGPLRRLMPDLSTAKLAGRLAARPRTTGRRLGALATELVRIGAGVSELAPAPRDRRFADPAWTRNPLLRRIVQAYLATGRTVDQLVADVDLSWRDDQRVRFTTENLLEALSPSNIPLLNPAAAKMAIDGMGMSLVRGALDVVRDMATAPRIPEMVDRSAFKVGDNLAARSEEHTSELQSRENLVCRLLLEK